MKKNLILIIFILSGGVTGFIMSIAWSIGFVHTLRGDKNKWLLSVIAMLMFS